MHNDASRRGQGREKAVESFVKRIRVTSAVAKKLTSSIEYLQETCQMGTELEMEVRASFAKNSTLSQNVSRSRRWGNA